MRTRLWTSAAAVFGVTGLALAAVGHGQEPSPATKGAGAAVAKGAADDRPELKPLRELHAAFVAAYNAADAKAMADLFTEDGSVVDSNGDATRGRAELAAMYAAAFQEAPGLKIAASVEGVKFLTPDVAQVEGQSELTRAAGAGEAAQLTRNSALLLRKDGRWKIAELRDYPVPAPDVSPYERLRELEWMVGDWVDESNNARVTAEVHWAENQSHLVRTYRVELEGEKPMSGTMFIGWDPGTGQIKSWVFDSEGGHGEALWTRATDAEWVVKAHGVLRDGRPTSATQVHTVVGPDSVKTRSFDRIIGGEIGPEVPEIVMVRKPPAPGAGGANKSKPGDVKPSGVKPGAAK